MKIYTKNGDTGNTQVYLSDVKRVSKDDLILQCYGDLDELNSQIGLLNALLSNEHLKRAASEPTNIANADLTAIQQDIFKIGFAISDTPQLSCERIVFLENKIDELSTTLAPQTHFILPGGSHLGAQAHVCRTVARRAERTLVALSKQANIPAECLQYVNRLSDLLFVAARYFNAQDKQADIVV